MTGLGAPEPTLEEELLELFEDASRQYAERGETLEDFELEWDWMSDKSRMQFLLQFDAPAGSRAAVIAMNAALLADAMVRKKLLVGILEQQLELERQAVELRKKAEAMTAVGNRIAGVSDEGP